MQVRTLSLRRYASTKDSRSTRNRKLSLPSTTTPCQKTFSRYWHKWSHRTRVLTSQVLEGVVVTALALRAVTELNKPLARQNIELRERSGPYWASQDFQHDSTTRSWAISRFKASTLFFNQDSQWCDRQALLGGVEVISTTRMLELLLSTTIVHHCIQDFPWRGRAWMWLDPHRERMMTIAERYCNFITFTKNHTMQDDVTTRRKGRPQDHRLSVGTCALPTPVMSKT
jgi:hypothetical protein